MRKLRWLAVLSAVLTAATFTMADPAQATRNPPGGGGGGGFGVCAAGSFSPQQRDPYNHTFNAKATCDNTNPAPIYATTHVGLEKGELRTGRSWFVCWELGDVNSVGGFGSTSYWYYTHGDVYFPGAGAHNSWGFVPGSFIDTSDAANGLAGKRCNFTSVPF
jgi:hypothetical protein